MKKKGFTLVELLAVIVILAIIALITVPIIMNIVESSKKATSVESANGYVRAVTNYLIMNVVDDGVYSVFDSNIKAEYTGTKVSNGSITIEKGNIKKANLCINDYSIDYINGVSSISNNDYCKDTNNKTLIVKKNNEELKSIYVGESTNILIDINDIDMNDVRNMSCNNGVVLTEENNNILINNILGNTNCYLNNTLRDAINNTDTTENNILLLKDEDIVGNVGPSIGDNKKIVLNMNNKKLEGNVNILFVAETGDLTINGDGIIYSNNITYSGNGAIKMHGGGNAKLTINGNECNSMNPEEYQSGLLIYADGNSAIANYGVNTQPDIPSELNINGGCYYSKQKNGIEVSGNTNANISNVNVSANSNGMVVYGQSNITSTNNDVVSSNGYAFLLVDTSTANIDGGKYISSGNVIVNNSSKDINITDKSRRVYIYTDGVTAEDLWLARTIVNFNSGNIRINGSVADKCGEEENTSGICIYNKNGRGITNDSTATGNIYINGAYISSENFVAVNNFSTSNIYVCSAKLDGKENDISINNTGYVYYNPSVVFVNNKMSDSYNDSSHIISKDDTSCE